MRVKTNKETKSNWINTWLKKKEARDSLRKQRRRMYFEKLIRRTFKLAIYDVSHVSDEGGIFVMHFRHVPHKKTQLVSIIARIE